MSLSLIDVDDKQIIEALTAKYNYHLQHSLKYKLMLDAYNGKFSDNVNVLEVRKTDTSNELVKETPKPEKNSNETFERIVLDILSDGQPRLVSELIEDYFKVTSKRFKNKDFSSKLSIRAKSPDKKIQNIKFKDFPLEKRFWWGKSSWFDGNLLKPEYTSKIHEKFKNMT